MYADHYSIYCRCGMNEMAPICTHFLHIYLCTALLVQHPGYSTTYNRFLILISSILKGM